MPDCKQNGVPHALAVMARFMLAVAVALMGINAEVFKTACAQSADNISKITAKAYACDAENDYVWITKGGAVKTISANGGQLRISINCVFADGSSVAQYDETDWAARSVPSSFTYDWNGECVSVDPQGVITALKDGNTDITVTATDELGEALTGSDGSKLTCTITIKTVNQGEGLMVKKIDIVDADGKAYGGDAVKLTSTSETKKLYVRAAFVDKTNTSRKVTYSNYPSAPKEEQPKDDVFKTLSWDVGDTQYASVSVHDGVASLKGIADATTEIRVSLTGGDASVDKGMGAGVVFDTVTLLVSIGKTVANGSPADKLKVRVVYENDISTVVKSKTYSVKQFEALGAVTRTYTLTRTNGKYATDKAYGVPIATLLAEFGIDTGDIAYFTLKANDGANPGKLSAKWLLKTPRYYLPNYDIGGSTQEKQQVPSMLALKDAWASNTDETGEMNSGTRFRLVFGSATKADNSNDKSIKFINTFTIVMSGSAPSQHGDDKEKKRDKKGAEDNGGQGSGGSGAGTGGGTGNSTGSGESGGSKTAGTVTQGGGQESQAGTVKAEDLTELDSESRWRIHQMMNKSKSDLDVTYEDNPLEPYLVPALIVLFAVSALYRYLLFRKRLT